MTQSINQIRIVATRPRPGMRWQPVVGPEVLGLVEKKLSDSDSRESVIGEAIDVLSRCVPPSAPKEQSTGLVVGYVQSGKTLSFTAVTALARDNGYRLVIVIAGTTKNLATQSRDRLLDDLGLQDTSFPKWQHFHNPSAMDGARIRDVLSEWADPNVPDEERRCVLVTVLKYHSRLRELVGMLSSLGNLSSTPALVIDDEADQASLNSLVREGALSTTYARIRELKATLPHHTFLQYTATPQGNLLINLIDVLSASFAVVLEPGVNYVGAQTFFASGAPYLELIPTVEIPTKDNYVEEAPPSFQKALMLFFIGAASGYFRKDSRPQRRSMMIHPARETVNHTQYFQWVQSIRALWTQILDLNDSDADRLALEDQFRTVHAELSRTLPDLERFDQLKIINAIRRVEVRLVNSRAQVRALRWEDNYSWILVGGQMLDRGFTVEGLTLTYMPRGPGVGYADTIQQRARFFGYKRGYLGFCRIFLESDVADVYRMYVEHEQHLRSRLIQHLQKGSPLSEFRRMFLLDRSLRPTRPEIYEVDYVRPQLDQGFFYPKTPDQSDLTSNQGLVSQFWQQNSVRFHSDDGHEARTPSQRHMVVEDFSLRNVYDELLLPFRVSSFEDNQQWITILEMIAMHLASESEKERVPQCAIVRMRPSEEARRATTEGKIDQLFQGAHPDAQGAIYPGDRNIRPRAITIQIHILTLTIGPVSDGRVLLKDVPVPAIWIDRSIQRDLLFQDQA